MQKTRLSSSTATLTKSVFVLLQPAMILRHRLHCATLLVWLSCLQAFNLPVSSFKAQKTQSNWVRARLPQLTRLQAAEGSLIDDIASVTADEQDSQSGRTVLDGSLAPTPAVKTTDIHTYATTLMSRMLIIQTEQYSLCIG
jgi:hypothetical protein